MRMPFSEFIMSGDLKFVVAFLALGGVALYHFIQKQRIKGNANHENSTQYHNLCIRQVAVWILSLSGLSLLLGLMHSFYFMGKVDNVAPRLIFQGVAYILITPVWGLSMYLICHVFQQLPLNKLGGNNK